MAATLLRVNDEPNINLKEFCVDSESELNNLPTTERAATGDFTSLAGFDIPAPMGSTCIVGNKGADDISIYLLFSFGWKKIG